LQSLLSFSCGIWAEQINTLLLPAVPVTFTQMCFSFPLSTSAINGASGLVTSDVALAIPEVLESLDLDRF
ncbi:MAG: hypothetical protein ACK559_25470, partial [bacterium]